MLIFFRKNKILLKIITTLPCFIPSGTDELHVKTPGRGEESPSLRARGLRGQHSHHHNYSSTNSSTPQSRSKAGSLIHELPGFSHNFDHWRERLTQGGVN